MKIIERIHSDGVFEEYRVELSESERGECVDGKTFRALSIAESICARWGIVAATLAAIPLAIWSDLK